MKNKKSIIFLIMWLTTVCTAFAQEDYRFLDNLGVSLKASPTLGYGLEASTRFHKQLILRAGINTTAGISLPYTNFELDENDDLMTSFGYIPEFRVKPKIAITHGNILLDFHPGGIFHITAGVYMGATQFKANGFYADSNNKRSVLLPDQKWPTIEIDDTENIEFRNGEAEVTVRIGRAVKPYFGFGVGRAVPQKKVSFKFEIGVLYQGNSYGVSQYGKTFDFAKSSNEDFRDIHDLLQEPYFGFWPQINFQLSYRIF